MNDVGERLRALELAELPDCPIARGYLRGRVISLTLKVGRTIHQIILDKPEDAEELWAALSKAGGDLRLMIKAAT